MQTITIKPREKHDTVITLRAPKWLAKRLNELSEQSGATLSSTACQLLAQATMMPLALQTERD